MAPPSYFTLHSDTDPKFCAVLDFPEDYSTYSAPAAGLRLADKYVPDTIFAMAKEAPGLVIPDFINNALHYLMVSERAKDLLLAKAGVEIEALKFVLRDHKKRLRPDPLFILNLIGSVDCVDRAKTQGAKDTAEPKLYFSITRLQLDISRVPPDLALFRLAALPSLMIVREDLRDAITAAGLTGAQFAPVGATIRAF